MGMGTLSKNRLRMAVCESRKSEQVDYRTRPDEAPVATTVLAIVAILAGCRVGRYSEYCKGLSSSSWFR